MVFFSFFNHFSRTVELEQGGKTSTIFCTKKNKNWLVIEKNKKKKMQVML